MSAAPHAGRQQSGVLEPNPLQRSPEPANSSVVIKGHMSARNLQNPAAVGVQGEAWSMRVLGSCLWVCLVLGFVAGCGGGGGSPPGGRTEAARRLRRRCRVCVR